MSKFYSDPNCITLTPIVTEEIASLKTFYRGSADEFQDNYGMGPTMKMSKYHWAGIPFAVTGAIVAIPFAGAYSTVNMTTVKPIKISSLENELEELNARAAIWENNDSMIAKAFR